jgi:large subunit ribosomal protein L36
MKVRTAVKRLCDTCRIVLRRGRVYVVCKANPKVVCVGRGCGRRAGAEAYG